MLVPSLKNNLCNVMFFCISHATLSSMPANPLERRPITQETMHAASRGLTSMEYHLLATFIEQKLHEAQQERVFGAKKTEPVFAKATAGTEAQLNQIFRDFYQHRYDQVLQGISALGYKPQEILHTSKLRVAMLSGKLEQTLWFLREIAGIDWFFERDFKRKRKEWPKPQDKLVYLMSLADELVMNHMKIFDPTIVLDAIDSLEKHIQQWQAKASKTFKQRIDGTLTKLESLRAEYTKEEAH